MEVRTLPAQATNAISEFSVNIEKSSENHDTAQALVRNSSWVSEISLHAKNYDGNTGLLLASLGK